MARLSICSRFRADGSTDNGSTDEAEFDITIAMDGGLDPVKGVIGIGLRLLLV